MTITQETTYIERTGDSRVYTTVVAAIIEAARAGLAEPVIVVTVYVPTIRFQSLAEVLAWESFGLLEMPGITNWADESWTAVHGEIAASVVGSDFGAYVLVEYPTPAPLPRRVPGAAMNAPIGEIWGVEFGAAANHTEAQRLDRETARADALRAEYEATPRVSLTDLRQMLTAGGAL